MENTDNFGAGNFQEASTPSQFNMYSNNICRKNTEGNGSTIDPSKSIITNTSQLYTIAKTHMGTRSIIEQPCCTCCCGGCKQPKNAPKSVEGNLITNGTFSPTYSQSIAPGIKSGNDTMTSKFGKVNIDLNPLQSKKSSLPIAKKPLTPYEILFEKRKINKPIIPQHAP